MDEAHIHISIKNTHANSHTHTTDICIPNAHEMCPICYFVNIIALRLYTRTKRNGLLFCLSVSICTMRVLADDVVV